MKAKKIILLILFISIAFSSCIGDVDFDQTQDIVFKPIAKVDLVYFKINKTAFETVDASSPMVTDFTNIQVFNNDLTTDNVDRVILKFEIENTFDKNFQLEYHLVNEADSILETIPFQINEMGQLTKDIEYRKNTPEYENLVHTKKISILIHKPLNMETTDADMFLHFKSAVDLFLIIDDI